MKNVTAKVSGKTLTITVDLSKDFGPSKSGLTNIIASTEGNQQVPGGEPGVKFGVTVYKKP